VSAVSETIAPVPLWQHTAFRWTLGLSSAAALALALGWDGVSDALYRAEFALADALGEAWIRDAAWLALPAVGVGAGLLASLSPCILPLVPLNAAYIGAAEAQGWEALQLSARFVVGAALALAVLGLAGDLAGVLLIEQRGPVLLGAGLCMLGLSLVSLELLPLPFAGQSLGGTRRLGALGAGAAFSVVTTPCASPLLAALLAASAAQGIPGLTVASMVGFALGYTALVFAAGVFGGGLVQRLKRIGFDAPRAAAGALLLVLGLGFVATGVAWFV
jgi:cytochrome c-type biogenesis protein